MKKTGRILATIIAITLAIAFYFLQTAVVIHAAEQPTSTPTLSNIKTNTYLLEADDVLIYGEYNLPYTSIPDDSASDTYIFRLFDTDNVTELGSMVPYAQFDSGYNKGAFSFYFSAADNLTIEQNYIIRISQSPAHFASPESWDYTMTDSAWTSKTTQADNRVELAINIIAIAGRLATAHDTTLLETSAGGTVLSEPAGANYFRGVIYGVQAMAPSLFLVQNLIFETADRAWTTDQFDEYQTSFNGTWLETTTANTSATFGFTNPALMALIYAMPICVGVVILSSVKFRRAEPGYLVSALVLICVALMGWIPTAIFALIYQLFAIYIGYLWFYARS